MSKKVQSEKIYSMFGKYHSQILDEHYRFATGIINLNKTILNEFLFFTLKGSVVYVIVI